MARYDMLVIGSGPAGRKAAIQAAKVGKKVGVIERKKVAGGICINVGTIPSKLLRSRRSTNFPATAPPTSNAPRCKSGDRSLVS